MMTAPIRMAGPMIATLALATGCVPVGVLDSEDVLGGLSKLILYPNRTCDELRERYGVDYLPAVDYPDEVGMAFEEHYVTLDDGVLLRVWYMPSRLDRGVVVYSPGNTGPMACYLFATELLVDTGWSVVMYEYEGFGLSSGVPSLDSLRRDLDAVVDWTLEHTGREQVSLMGMSLGSIPSIAVAVDRPDVVNGVILDSPIAMMAQVERFGIFVGGQTQAFLARLDGDLLSDSLIGFLEQPLLIFLHEKDWIATPESVERLYERASGPKRIVRFPDLGHASSQFVNTDIYLYYIETFLADAWRVEAVDVGAEDPAAEE